MTGRRALAVALGLRLGLGARVAGAVTPLDQITPSPDVTTGIQGQTVNDEGVLDDDLQAAVALASIPGIPANADLVGYALLPNGQEMFALDVTVNLPGSVTAEPRDVVLFDSGTNASTTCSTARPGASRTAPGSTPSPATRASSSCPST